jgi:ABC-2 type transport system ATP-binding protein
MRQKILIAAAVLHNPRIVILDEPFSGLDVSAARGAEGVSSDRWRPKARWSCSALTCWRSSSRSGSRVAILKDGRMVGHDSVENLRQTLKLPTLDAVFATLVEETNVEGRTRALVEAMHLQ